MPPRRRFAVRGRSQKRQSVWFEFPPSQISVAAPSTAFLGFSLNAAALALRPFTVVRTRGSLFYRSDQNAGIETYGGGFGIAVVSDQATAIGVTAVPTPVTDYGSDLWFVIEQMYGRFVFGDLTGMVEGGQQRMLDSKAMRKVDVGQDIVVVFETPAQSSSFLVEAAFRMLVKLH